LFEFEPTKYRMTAMMMMTTTKMAMIGPTLFELVGAVMVGVVDGGVTGGVSTRIGRSFISVLFCWSMELL